jgi:Leucine-rich repeat (LRR) protein
VLKGINDMSDKTSFVRQFILISAIICLLSSCNTYTQAPTNSESSLSLPKSQVESYLAQEAQLNKESDNEMPTPYSAPLLDQTKDVAKQGESVSEPSITPNDSDSIPVTEEYAPSHDDDKTVPKELWGKWIYNESIISRMCNALYLSIETEPMKGYPDDTDFYEMSDLRNVTFGELRRCTFNDMYQITLPGASGIAPIVKEFKLLKSMAVLSDETIHIIPELFEMESLESLSFNAIVSSCIPPGISKMKRLKELTVLGVQCTIPELFELPSLERLAIEGITSSQKDGLSYVLEELSPDIGKLTNLKELDLRNNNLKHLPDELWEIDSLELLRIGGNQIEDIPQSVMSRDNLRIQRH